MKKLKNVVIPNRYVVCSLAECPLAKTCLRQLAYALLLDDEDERCLSMLKPRFCSRNEDCEYYRGSIPVKFARGFTNFQRRMYPQQYQTFMKRLIALFGRNSYFVRRRGECLIPPEEQRVILETLRQVGVTENLAFDAYEEMFYW